MKVTSGSQWESMPLRPYVFSGRRREEGGDTTLLNNCGASQIKNSKVFLKGTKILLCRHVKHSFQGGSLVKSILFR